MKARVVALTAAAAMLALPRTGAAQPQPPTPARMDEAEQLYELGLAKYEAGDYTSAIAEWTRAYELSAAPLMIFNLAQGYRLRKAPGDCAKAVDAYQRYVQLDPGGEKERDAEQFVAELTPCEESVATAPALPTHQIGARPGRTKQIAGIVVGGAGVLLVGTGVYFGVQASSRADDITSACASGCDWAAQHDADASGRRAERLQWGFLGAGAGAVVAGAIVYYLGSRSSREAPRVVATPSRGGGSVVASWAW